MMEVDGENLNEKQQSKHERGKFLFRQTSLTDMGGYAAGCESADENPPGGSSSEMELFAVTPPPQPSMATTFASSFTE